MRKIAMLMLLALLAGCVAEGGADTCRVVSAKEVAPWRDRGNQQLSCNAG